MRTCKRIMSISVAFCACEIGLSMRKILLFIPVISLACASIEAQPQDSVVGVASYYANRFHGRKTASGETYNKDGFTCAHLKYKFGTKLRIKHLATGKEVVVRVTDRGPYSKKYSIDLSYAAAQELGIVRAGHAKVAIFPYDESMERQKSEAKIPSFLEFRSGNKELPRYAYKDTMHIEPILLPITDVNNGKKKKK